VLLAAGPFESTSGPVLDACLRAGVHYLDIAEQIGVIERVLGTRTKRITAMPAVGFGTAVTAARVWRCPRLSGPPATFPAPADGPWWRWTRQRRLRSPRSPRRPRRTRSWKATGGARRDHGRGIVRAAHRAVGMW
jgi:hypothetical protein